MDGVRSFRIGEFDTGTCIATGSRRSFRALVLSAAGMLALFASAPALAAPAPFTLAATRELVGVSMPRISPDAHSVVYVRSRGDFKEDVNLTELVLVDLQTGSSRVLTHGRPGVSSPAWSPDGTRLAFLASPEKGKPPQIYVMPMNGGDALAVTAAKNGVSEFAWSRDGLRFAFATDDDAPKAKDGAKYNDAFEVTDEHFLVRGPSVATRIGVVGAEGTGERTLTSGGTSASKSGAALKWTADGDIVYNRQPDATFASFPQQTPVRLNPRDSSERPLFPDASAVNADIAATGSAMAYLKPRHGSLYLQVDAFVVTAPGSAPVANTLKIDRNVHWTGFSGDGTALLAGVSDGVRNVLWRVPVSGAPATPVDLGDVDFAPDASVARDGTIAFVGLRRERPAEIYVLAPGAAPRAVSDDNGAVIARYTIGRSVRVDWAIDNGMKACGVLTYPPNADPAKKYPLILIIHGGPVATSTWNFSGQAQIAASRGYLVFQPNYRGSDDLGDAFLQAIVGDVTSGPGKDNLAGVAAVEALGIVDESRIGVSGWSGGGLQTAWLVGHSHIWKAAVSGAAVDNWIEQAALADINEQFAEVFMGGASPWTKEGRAEYLAESPITYASAVTTPTMILSDTRDQRVPITQSYAFYRALKAHGVTVRFVAFPRAGHFPTDPVGREAVLRTWQGWFDQWMNP